MRCPAYTIKAKAVRAVTIRERKCCPKPSVRAEDDKHFAFVIAIRIGTWCSENQIGKSISIEVISTADGPTGPIVGIDTLQPETDRAVELGKIDVGNCRNMFCCFERYEAIRGIIPI